MQVNSLKLTKKDSNLNEKKIFRGYYKNGNVIDFQTYSSLSSTSGVFTIQTSWQCPTPTCQTIIDLVQSKSLFF